MNQIFDNWLPIVVILVILAVIISAVIAFFKLPSKKQMEKVKEWLLYAVTQAEIELGGGTGQLKLRVVYDLFIRRFKWISRFISFETFSALVDEALKDMRRMLSSNQAMKALTIREVK